MARNRSTKKRKKKSKKLKGVRYIAQKLRKYYPKRYPNFNSALTKARVILEELKSQGKKVSVVNMFSIERVPRQLKENIPQIPDDFLEVQDFFDLQDYPTIIETQLPTNLYIVSKISKSNLSQLQGGIDNDTKIDDDVYEVYFKDFVTFGNRLQTSSGNRYPLKFRMTEPSSKIEKGKWISFIISCDESGDKLDYGFDPDNIDSDDSYKLPKDNYDSMSYNDLRKEISERKIPVKNPSKKKMIELLRDDDLSKQPTEFPKKNTKEPFSTKDSDEKFTPQQKIDYIKEKNRAEELSIRKKELELEERNQKIKEQELDMEKIQYGIMTVAEFKKKWS